jgi:hypothetical protein
MFIRTEELRMKWQSFTAQLIINQKQPDEEEVFNYLCSVISNFARCTPEIRSIIVMSKAGLKNKNTSLQILEEESVMCYIWSICL